MEVHDGSSTTNGPLCFEILGRCVCVALHGDINALFN